jgi:hypothetical protein
MPYNTISPESIEVSYIPKHKNNIQYRWLWILNDIQNTIVRRSDKWFSNREECYSNGLCMEPSFDEVRDSPTCLLILETVCSICQITRLQM